MLSFRTLTGALLPILTVIIGVIWTMGIIVLCGFDITVANSIIPVALIAIGTAYSIHIINKYYGEHGKREKRIVSTLKDVGVAVILSGLTTAVGFLSLLTADIKPVWVMGIFCAVGVAICDILSLFFVPAVLYYLNPKPKIISEEGKENQLQTRNQYNYYRCHRCGFIPVCDKNKNRHGHSEFFKQE